ncbi:MAG: glycosyltransferase family 2 protein [Desulfobacteraceae bacterium]|jgi:glycosyltransferase involved in cell wall biosynthesis|nr:glycosyltransferase family 2 protein [Desulfobacteraceae bacterium]
MSTLFSVIMPVYNREKLIIQALNSVKIQTYRPIEIIVVNDGSIDGTANVVDEWRRVHEDKNDFQVKYFFQENAGPSSARNHGLLESHGEFIQFLDSDDLISPNRLEILANIFKQDSKVDFIQTGFDGFCAGCSEVIEQHYGNPNEDLLVLALKGRLWPNTLRSGFRRSLIVDTGPWNKDMTCFEDYEYVARALVKARKSIAIKDILASARRGGGMRVSDNLRTYQGRTFRIMCEAALYQGIQNRTDIPLYAKQAFASRLYALGFRSNAKGWKNLGKLCGKFAESLGVELDGLGRRRKLVYNLGKWGGSVYDFMGRIKNRKVHNKQRFLPVCHTCSKG